jgi:hypothetical protein
MQLHVVAVVVKKEAGGIVNNIGSVALETVDLVRVDVSFEVYFALFRCSHEYIISNINGTLVVRLVRSLLKGAMSKSALFLAWAFSRFFRAEA